jgi:uncharacterized membrane protein
MADAQAQGDSREAKVLLGVTEAGKEIYLVRKRGVSIRVIQWGDGGELPAEFAGGFSSISAAKEVVTDYLARKVEVKKVIGKPAVSNK